MPIIVRSNAEVHAAIKPHQPDFAFSEIMGNKQASCLVLSWAGSTPTSYKYDFDVFYVVLEGEVQFEDTAEPGKITFLKTGDYAHISDGMTLTWSTPTKCKVFAVAIKPFGDEGHLVNVS